MGRNGIERRLVDEPVAEVAAVTSDLVAGREPPQLTRRFVMLPRTGLIMMCRF